MSAELVQALVAAAGSARWPDGSLLVDLDATVIRDQFAPLVLDRLGISGSPARRLLNLDPPTWRSS